MSRELPARPSLEHLKSQAKELLDACARGEPSALERFRSSLPAARAGGTPPKPFALHDAQSVLAREYGFESWSALRREVARRRPLSQELLRSLLPMPLPPQVEASLLGIDSLPRKPLPQLPARLPLVAVRNAVILVGSVVPLCLARARSLAALDAARAGAGLLGLFAQTRYDVEDPGRSELFEIGCAAQILAVHRDAPPGVWIVLRALQPLRLEDVEDAGAYTAARVAPFELCDEDAAEVPDLARELLARAGALARALPDSERLLRLLEELAPAELADLVVANLQCTVQEKADYASEANLPRRLTRARALIDAARAAPA